MKKTIKVLIYVLISILSFLVITNPSHKKFKEFLGGKGHNYRRTSNWIVFSMYEVREQRYSNEDSYSITYIGIALNFFEL